MSTESTDLRYPIGKYTPQPFSGKLKDEWLNDIKFLPQLLENTIVNLDEAQLLTPYREGGWTVQQLVHHVADSHMNACPYEEKLWAELNDVTTIPVNISITLLYALHTRWYTAISDLTIQDWERTVFHPEQKKKLTLWYLLGNYAWHGRHHAAHITALRERNKW
jgi:hypothetical protein